MSKLFIAFLLLLFTNPSLSAKEKNSQNEIKNIKELKTNIENRDKLMEDMIRKILLNLDKTKFLGSDFDYWPDGGLRSTYDHLKGTLSYRLLNQISPYEVFINNLHTKNNLVLNSRYSFGYYNPKFINWISDRVATVLDDGSFVKKSKKLFDKYLKSLFITYWMTYRTLDKDKNEKQMLTNEYLSLIKSKKLPDGYYYDIAWNSEKFDFMNYLVEENKLNINVVAPAVYFWIRRSVDGTDEKIYLIIDSFLRAYEPNFIYYNK